MDRLFDGTGGGSEQGDDDEKEAGVSFERFLIYLVEADAELDFDG